MKLNALCIGRKRCCAGGAIESELDREMVRIVVIGIGWELILMMVMMVIVMVVDTI